MNIVNLDNIIGITVHDFDGQIAMNAASVTEFRSRCFIEGWPQTGTAIVLMNDGEVEHMSVPELNYLIDEDNVDAAEQAAICDAEPDWDTLEANAYGSVYGRSTPIVDVDVLF